MTVRVVIPWRPQPDRLVAYQRVTEFWAHHGFTVVESDSDKAQPFHAAQARNRGADRADADVLIFCDADTIPDIASVTAALRQVRDDLVYPYDTYRLLPNEYSNKADLVTVPYIHQFHDTPGGIFVIRSDTYWSLGGMDEMFEPCWGYEDSAFMLAAQTLIGMRRISGRVYAFDHHADRDMTETNPNLARYRIYQHCQGRPDEMRRFIDARHL